VNHTQFAFIRELEDERVVVVLNNAEQPEELNLTLPWKNGTLKDLLESERTFQIQDGRANLILPPIWGRILSVKG
jgi:1,4-alpha-glucan branching enzyme